MKNKTESFYQPLFDHMHQEHGLTLLESEMADIIHLVEKMQEDRPQGAATDDEIKAAWKKRMGISFDEYGADAASVIRLGAVWVKASERLPTKEYNSATDEDQWTHAYTGENITTEQLYELFIKLKDAKS